MLAEYNYFIGEFDKAKKLAQDSIIELKKSQDKISELKAHDLIDVIKNSKEKPQK